MGDVKRKKLVIVGDTGCGKTCLLSVFGKGRFLEPEEYVPTIFDSDGTASIEVARRGPRVQIGPCLRLGSLEAIVNVELSLWDTGGHEELDRFRRISYPDADVVLICFAVDEPASLKSVLDKWAPEVRHFCGRTPVVLVRTKRDLAAECSHKPDEEADQVAKSIGAWARLDCSAKSGEGVREVFEAAAKAALTANKKKSKYKL